MDKPKCWVKNAIKKFTVEKVKVKVEFGLKFEITFLTKHLVCPYFTQIWVQTTQHCLEWMSYK